MSYRRPYYRGGPRNGPVRPHNDGPGFSMPNLPVRGIYDYSLDKSNLHGTKNTLDVVFEKEIIDRAANLTPPKDVRNQILEFAKKVISALEKEKTEKSLPNVGVEQIKNVGSFVTDTCTHSSDKTDVVVQLNSLPSFETVTELGDKVVENMKLADPKDTSVALPQEYGVNIMSAKGVVRILVTIHPKEASKLEPGLHLDARHMMINYFAVRHTNWNLELQNTMTPEFLSEYRALIRVLKDARTRLKSLQPLSIWALQYLAFFSLANGPNRQKISLGTAFRRFFEVLAAGILLPKAPVLIDPTSPVYRIGFDLTLQDMDTLCIGAQTIVKIFAIGGNDGFRAVLGTEGTAADLTQTTSTWKGVEIRPGVEAFKENCMGTD